MSFTFIFSPFTLPSPFTMNLGAAANSQWLMANVLKIENGKLKIEDGGRS